MSRVKIVAKKSSELSPVSGLKPSKTAKPRVKTKMVKKASKGTKVVSKMGKKIPLIHFTDRYGKKGDSATRPMLKRYALQKHIASGKATLGNTLEQFGTGRNGLCRVARYVRKGLWTINGVKPTPEAKNDFEAERTLANKLAKMNGALKIGCKDNPLELLKR